MVGSAGMSETCVPLHAYATSLEKDIGQEAPCVRISVVPTHMVFI